jgi:hypothetical protein
LKSWFYASWGERIHIKERMKERKKEKRVKCDGDETKENYLANTSEKNS